MYLLISRVCSGTRRSVGNAAVTPEATGDSTTGAADKSGHAESCLIMNEKRKKEKGKRKREGSWT